MVCSGIRITSNFISIHALLAESDIRFFKRGKSANYFYPRSPCGERPAWNRFTQRRDFISIHALLAESDMGCIPWSQSPLHFYPRSPCGERPRSGAGCLICLLHFYPRSPCGERLMISETVWLIIVFLSTLSLRRATIVEGFCSPGIKNFYPRSPCGERRFIIVYAKERG